MEKITQGGVCQLYHSLHVIKTQVG